MEAMITFTPDGIGGITVGAATKEAFDGALLSHRMAEAVEQMVPDIMAKANGQYTDGDRYRAMRAMWVLNNRNEPLAIELLDKLGAFQEANDDSATESTFDIAMNHLIDLLNAEVEKVTGKAAA